MGQYKVPQDVEAEDKLVGPLTLRQFIYVVIGIAWGGLMWLIFRNVPILMIVLIIPVSGLFLLLGFGRRQEQSFESYFAAAIKFMLEPRIRVWDKDLAQDVMIRKETKPVEVVPTKTLNRGSLKQLAMIMDTHGTLKDPTIQLQDEANTAISYGERIIAPEGVAGTQSPSNAPTAITTQRDDMLDVAGEHGTQVNQLLENVEADIHSQALTNIKKNLVQPTKNMPTQKHLAPQTSNAIIKKAVAQGSNLTVQQIAKTANSGILPEGRAVSINQPQ